jgi:hypothetical protein
VTVIWNKILTGALVVTFADEKQAHEQEESKAQTADDSNPDQVDQDEESSESEEESEKKPTKEQKKAKKAAAIAREKAEAEALKQQSLQKGEDGKMEVNMDYVKHKARKQFKSGQAKQKSKRNKNKDKGQMKGKEEIKDYFYDEF